MRNHAPKQKFQPGKKYNHGTNNPIHIESGLPTGGENAIEKGGNSKYEKESLRFGCLDGRKVSCLVSGGPSGVRQYDPLRGERNLEVSVLISSEEENKTRLPPDLTFNSMPYIIVGIYYNLRYETCFL